MEHKFKYLTIISSTLFIFLILFFMIKNKVKDISNSSIVFCEEWLSESKSDKDQYVDYQRKIRLFYPNDWTVQDGVIAFSDESYSGNTNILQLIPPRHEQRPENIKGEHGGVYIFSNDQITAKFNNHFPETLLTILKQSSKRRSSLCSVRQFNIEDNNYIELYSIVSRSGTTIGAIRYYCGANLPQCKDEFAGVMTSINIIK